MLHGTQAFFEERERARRRVAGLTVALSVTLLAGQLVTLLPPLRRAAHALLDRSPMLQHFGFLGPERVVKKVFLEDEVTPELRLRNGVRFQPLSALRGGPPHHRDNPSPHARIEPRTTHQGPGFSERDLVARARALYRSAPVFQSQDLVIERMVRPEYPDEARARGIEGKVALVALVDTTGTVVDVDMMATSGVPALEQAATAAVWQCRFRPYRQGGHPREVFVVFPFNFHLY